MAEAARLRELTAAFESRLSLLEAELEPMRAEHLACFEAQNARFEAHHERQKRNNRRQMERMQKNMELKKAEAVNQKKAQLEEEFLFCVCFCIFRKIICMF